MRDVVTIAKALSDDNRVHIVAMLDGRELCVCQVIELLELAPSTVSKHLSILKQARVHRRAKRRPLDVLPPGRRRCPAGRTRRPSLDASHTQRR